MVKHTISNSTLNYQFLVVWLPTKWMKDEEGKKRGGCCCHNRISWKFTTVNLEHSRPVLFSLSCFHSISNNWAITEREWYVCACYEMIKESFAKITPTLFCWLRFRCPRQNAHLHFCYQFGYILIFNEFIYPAKWPGFN